MKKIFILEDILYPWHAVWQIVFNLQNPRTRLIWTLVILVSREKKKIKVIFIKEFFFLKKVEGIILRNVWWGKGSGLQFLFFILSSKLLYFVCRKISYLLDFNKPNSQRLLMFYKLWRFYICVKCNHLYTKYLFHLSGNVYQL